MASIGTANSESKKILLDHINNRIEYFCDKHSDTNGIKIEPAIVKAIIKQESQFKPYSMRYESHLKDTNNNNSKWYRNLLTEKEQTNKFSYYSMGLMQILYGIAKAETGYKGTQLDLLKIDNSLNCGIIYLKKLINKYWIIEDVISAYNQGVVKGNKGYYKSKFIDQNNNGIKDKIEIFINKMYVRSVLKNYQDLYYGSIDVSDDIRKYSN